MTEGTSVYLCADGTLTYGPIGGLKKIIKAALPVVQVKDPTEAERLIGLVGSKAWHPISDPKFESQLKGRTIQPGYGPDCRYFYSLRNFERDNVETLFDVRDTMEQLRDAMRTDNSPALRSAMAAANA